MCFALPLTNYVILKLLCTKVSGTYSCILRYGGIVTCMRSLTQSLANRIIFWREKPAYFTLLIISFGHIYYIAALAWLDSQNIEVLSFEQYMVGLCIGVHLRSSIPLIVFSFVAEFLGARKYKQHWLDIILSK